MPAQPNEVEVTQYLRPNGMPRQTFAPVGEDYVKKAEGMIFTAEVLTTWKVVIYGRRIGQPVDEEVSEIAENSPGPNTPLEALRRIIDRLAKQKEEKG